MDSAVWMIGIGFATFMLGIHQYMRGQQKVLEKKIDDRVEKCVTTAMRPITDDLAEIKTKVKNGLVHASEQHTEAISDLKVDVGRLAVSVDHMANDVGNLSRQLESVLLGKGQL